MIRQSNNEHTAAHDPAGMADRMGQILDQFPATRGEARQKLVLEYMLLNESLEAPRVRQTAGGEAVDRGDF